MCDVDLARGLTNIAVREYLESNTVLAPLASCIVDATVLGDTLIDAIDQQNNGSPTALIVQMVALLCRKTRDSSAGSGVNRLETGNRK